MKRNSVLIILILGCHGCFQEEKKENKQLDTAMLDLQRMAMWHREFYFQVMKWRGKNQDSTDFYEKKMDSALTEYQKHMRTYDSLSKMHKANNEP